MAPKLAVTLLVLVAASTACSSGRERQDPPLDEGTAAAVELPPELAGRELAFSRGDETASDIYVARTDGSSIRQVTRGAGVKYDPDWSPDGTRIVYRFEPAGSRLSSIRVVNADGSGDYDLGRPAGLLGMGPAWSPDGARIAFAGARGPRDRPAGIYLVDPNGSNPVRLTPKTIEAQYPAWSPDGRRIAFSGVARGGFDLYVVNADGSQLRRLTRTPEAENWPMWSPDGRRIAFHVEAGASPSLGVIAANGSARGVIAFSPAIEPAPDCGVPGNWTPARRILINCTVAGGRIGIGALAADGGEFHVLLRGADAGFPALRPDPRG